MTAIQGDRSEEFNTYGVHYTNETVADTADADTVDKCARSSHADVIWRCSKCRAYLEVCAKVPKQVDAFTSAAGRKHSDCKGIDIFRQHEKSDFHQQALKHEATEVGDKAAGKNTTQPKMPDVLTPEEELQNNYILGVIWLVVFQVALCLIGPLRDLAQCWGVSMPPAMSHYQTLEIIDAIYEYFRRFQRWRMRRVRVYSPLGDGSTDISTTEQECVGLRISWGGLPRNEFIGIEALDLKDGRDGKSPDAQCLSKCYDRQMEDLLDPELPEIGPEDAELGPVAPVGHWLHRTVGCSFDGASVNTGEITGLYSLWKVIAPWILLVHGIAHVVELACSAAYDSIKYFVDIVNPTLEATVTAYHQSGKKQWNAVRISAELKESRWYKLCSFSKTRW